jgi:hypothetical protein
VSSYCRGDRDSEGEKREEVRKTGREKKNSGKRTVREKG